MSSATTTEMVRIPGFGNWLNSLSEKKRDFMMLNMRKYVKNIDGDYFVKSLGSDLVFGTKDAAPDNVHVRGLHSAVATRRIDYKTFIIEKPTADQVKFLREHTKLTEEDLKYTDPSKGDRKWFGPTANYDGFIVALHRKVGEKGENPPILITITGYIHRFDSGVYKYVIEQAFGPITKAFVECNEILLNKGITVLNSDDNFVESCLQRQKYYGGNNYEEEYYEDEDEYYHNAEEETPQNEPREGFVSHSSAMLETISADEAAGNEAAKTLAGIVKASNRLKVISPTTKQMDRLRRDGHARASTTVSKTDPTPAEAAGKQSPTAAEPAKPATEPAKPAAEPATEPAAEPAKPAAEPAAEPAKPAAEPAKPAAEPAKPTAEPAKPSWGDELNKKFDVPEPAAAKPAEPAAAKPAEPVAAKPAVPEFVEVKPAHPEFVEAKITFGIGSTKYQMKLKVKYDDFYVGHESEIKPTGQVSATMPNIDVQMSIRFGMTMYQMILSVKTEDYLKGVSVIIESLSK